MKHLPLIGAAILVAFSFVPVSRPAADDPVATALKSASSSDRARVASIYKSLADVTRRDRGQQITTLGQWRAVHASALRLAAGGTDLVGKYPGLDTAVDAVLRKRIGDLTNAPMSADMVTKLADGCAEVAYQSE
jgi:hypothetical protein